MRLRSYTVPKWAQKLITEVCVEEGIVRPAITWQKLSRPESSGTSWPFRIRITAGTVRKEVKEVLLHELTHSVLGQHGGYGGRLDNGNHGAEFYAKLFAVAKRHGIGAAYIKSREHWYRPRGLKAGYRLYLSRLRGA